MNRSLGVPKQSGVALRKIETTRRPSRPLDRIERAHVDKFSARRIELAEAALETLAELGYAKTSLREIAQKSEFTHGVLHYYFRDKVDLICCCVRHYKAKCVTRYDQVTAAAQSRDELMKGFLEKLGETVRDEAQMHRLWYDLARSLCLKGPFATTSPRSIRAWKIWCGASRPALPHLVADSLSSPRAPFMRCLMDFSSDACCDISRAIARPSRTCGKKWSASSRSLDSGRRTLQTTTFVLLRFC